jgi:uncharacterized OsmC-like protein
MDRDELRAAQAPLKKRYRDEPAAARITLSADGVLGSESVACSVQTGSRCVTAGLHPATGGDGSLACSGDLLLQALAACAGVTMRAVALSLGLQIAGRIRVEGDLDFRGTLGVDKSAPVGFTDIRVQADLETDATEEQVDTLRRLIERHCVVLQTLVRSPAVSLVTTRTGTG